MTESTHTPPTDVFHWANTTDRDKDRLEIDLFLFTKGYTVYATRYDEKLKQQLKVLFLYDMISGVQTGAATGVVVRDIDNIDRDDGVILRTPLERVEHAQEVIEQIAYGEEGLEVFSESDHEFKKVKGIVARFRTSKTDSEEQQTFYVTKLLPQSQVLKGESAWMFSGTSFQPFSAEAGLRVTPDNQVLMVDDTIFVFSETKFERLFGYSAKKFAVAEAAIQAIESKYTLTLPDGLTLADMARDNKTLVNKLQKVDVDATTQEKVIETADELELELMSDDASGAIILADAKDATKFVDLISDDYLTSSMTGVSYLVKNKKPLGDAATKPPADPLVQLAERDIT